MDIAKVDAIMHTKRGLRTLVLPLLPRRLSTRRLTGSFTLGAYQPSKSTHMPYHRPDAPVHGRLGCWIRANSMRRLGATIGTGSCDVSVGLAACTRWALYKNETLASVSMAVNRRRHRPGGSLVQMYVCTWMQSWVRREGRGLHGVAGAGWRNAGRCKSKSHGSANRYRRLSQHHLPRLPPMLTQTSNSLRLNCSPSDCLLARLVSHTCIVTLTPRHVNTPNLPIAFHKSQHPPRAIRHP